MPSSVNSPSLWVRSMLWQFANATAALHLAMRVTEKALGHVSYEVTAKEEASRAFRRSLFVVQDMREGEKFTPENTRSIRPGHGLAPKYLADIIGKRASRFIERGTPVSWNLIGG